MGGEATLPHKATFPHKVLLDLYYNSNSILLQKYGC